jgi:hypothetical protein
VMTMSGSARVSCHFSGASLTRRFRSSIGRRPFAAYLSGP